MGSSSSVAVGLPVPRYDVLGQFERFVSDSRKLLNQVKNLEPPPPLRLFGCMSMFMFILNTVSLFTIQQRALSSWPCVSSFYSLVVVSRLTSFSSLCVLFIHPPISTHPPSPISTHPFAGHFSGEEGASPRVYFRDEGRLRHAGGGARGAAERGAEAAHRHRPRVLEKTRGTCV